MVIDTEGAGSICGDGVGMFITAICPFCNYW